jgi:hypothetical protein
VLEKSVVLCEKELLNGDGPLGFWGADECNTCPWGTRGTRGTRGAVIGAHTGEEGCITCERGDYSDVFTSAYCKPCPSGTYSSVRGPKLDNFLPSPLGSFARRTDSIELCPKHTYSTVTGAANDSVCAPCFSGHRCATRSSFQTHWAEETDASTKMLPNRYSPCAPPRWSTTRRFPSWDSLRLSFAH